MPQIRKGLCDDDKRCSYGGRYSPRNAYGKREAHNICAKTCEECEEKLAAMIAQVKADIKVGKERLKTVNGSFSLETR